MASYNRSILVGNLTKDPETKFLPSGQAVCNMSIAVNERWTKDGEKKEYVSFFDIVAWGKLAELCAQYLKKGRPVLVEGKLRQERWEKEGSKRSKVVITAENVQFLGGREEEKEEKEDLPF